MVIKSADDRQPDVEALNVLLGRPDVVHATRTQIETEIRSIRAGDKGERDAAYLIDLHFGRSENWAVIHDLRIEVTGHVAQIDHVIINRLAQVWLCESKHFAEGVAINEHGEWSRWYRGRAEGMPSPVEQNRRHALVLERAFEDGLVLSPKRWGLVRWKPQIKTLVLVSDNARIDRPKRKVDGVDTVIKAEQLQKRLFDEFNRAPDRSLLGVIGKEGLEHFARELASLHRPLERDWEARFGLPPTTAPVPSVAPVSPPAAAARETATRKPWFVKFDGPCAKCGRILVKGTEAHWSQRAHRMHCLDCAIFPAPRTTA